MNLVTERVCRVSELSQVAVDGNISLGNNNSLSPLLLLYQTNRLSKLLPPWTGIWIREQRIRLPASSSSRALPLAWLHPLTVAEVVSMIVLHFFFLLGHFLFSW